MKKISLSLVLDYSLFHQLVSLSKYLSIPLNKLISHLLDLSLYSVFHSYYPFDDWCEQMLNYDYSED